MFKENILSCGFNKGCEGIDRACCVLCVGRSVLGGHLEHTLCGRYMNGCGKRALC